MSKSLTASLWGSLILLVVAALPVNAADNSKAFVVLVGIDNYADAQVKAHPKAEADVTALYDVLTNKDYLSLDKDRVKLLLGKADDKRGSLPATRQNILDAARWLAKEAGPNDLAVFAFFGSGGPLAQKTCYFAADSTFKNRAKDAIAADDLAHEFDELKSQRFVALLDVDFKAFDVPKADAVELNPANLYREYLGKDDNTAGRLVFLAHRGTSPSLIDQDHGVFAHVLLDGLKGGADSEGYEADGLVTSAELADFIEKEVLARSRKLGKPQTSFSVGHAAPFVVTRNPKITAKVQERTDKLKQLANTKVLPNKIVEEGTALLQRMPKLEAQKSLRKAFQQLVDGKLPVDDFLKERTRILEGTRLGSEDAGRFAARVMQAIDQVTESYVEKLDRGEMAAWAAEGLFERVDEKVPADLAKKLKDLKGQNDDALSEALTAARLHLGKREDLDNHKDIDHALQRMLGHLDPYTTYVDPETVAQFLRDIRRNYTGVGIQIRKDLERDMLRVVTPIKGSPAYKAGIKAGDLVTTIKRTVDGDGNPLPQLEIIDTRGLSIADAVKKVLGKENTKVTLTVEREGVEKPFDVVITRASIELETVSGFKRTDDDNWDYLIDAENRILYIRLTGFASNTARDLRRVIDAASREGIKGLVLDLRFNPGGLLRAAVSISDMFIDEGNIVSIRPRVGESEVHKGTKGGFLDFPIVCLVNGGSASASEIVSACLQDHKRATIIGERSFGKGSVQNIHPFDGGQLKLTIASFWRPSGKNLNKASTKGRDDDVWGVSPDVLVPLSRGERDQLAEFQLNTEIIQRKDAKVKPSDFKDKQLEAALENIRKNIKLASQERSKKAS